MQPFSAGATLMRLLIALFFTVISAAAVAHHNYRLRYDYDTVITLTGVVTNFDWKNPHVEIYMDVADENGNVINWTMPTGAPGVFNRIGISPDTVAAGDRLVVSGAPARNGSNEMRARSMTLEDGTWYWLSPGQPPEGFPDVPEDFEPIQRNSR